MSGPFNILVEDLFRLLGEEAPALDPSASGATSVLLNVADAWFELACAPGLHPDRFLLELRLGPPPDDGDALLELLQANLDLLRAQDAAFGWRRAADELVYEALIPLHDCDPTLLLERMKQFAVSVHEWKARRQFTTFTAPLSAATHSNTPPPDPTTQQARAAVIDVFERLCEDERTLRAETAGEVDGEALVAMLGFEEIDVRLIHLSPAADVVLLEFGFGPTPHAKDTVLLLELMEIDGYGLLDSWPVLAADIDEGQLYACRVCPVSSMSPESLLTEARLAGEQLDAWLAATFPDLVKGTMPIAGPGMPDPAQLPSAA